MLALGAFLSPVRYAEESFSPDKCSNGYEIAGKREKDITSNAKI